MSAKKIVETAKGFIGQAEIKGNKGFESKEFERLMERVGWRTGWAWCSLFAELVLKLAYKGNDDVTKELDKLCNASAVKTLKNFRNAGYKVSGKATPGAVAIWQSKRRGVKSWTGHVGIVTKVHKDYFETVEGNTGSGGVREGEVVATRKRRYNFDAYNGLELQGFIWPIGDQVAEAEPWPFTTKAKGNKFRQWVNDKHPDVAKKIDLDPKGSNDNNYIRRAYEELKELYNV